MSVSEGSREGRRTRVPALVAALVLTMLQPGPAGAAERFGFDIPAQPLADAIEAFGRVTGLEVGYRSEVAEGVTSPGASGDLTADEALRRLLEGTGLTYRFTSPTAVTIEPATAAGGDRSGPAGPDTVTLAPVTVTGERVERPLAETASSVSVLDAGALGQRPDLGSTNDALERIPNVTAAGTSNLAPAVRGVDGTGPAQGADAFFAGVRPRLNVQIDGRPTSYNEVVFGDGSLWDVERVEVFRGPQSTIQGRNAIAGAVVVKTKDPTYHPEASAQVVAGNQKSRQVSATVSGPIVDDQLALRLSFDRKTHQSYVHMGQVPGVEDPRDFETTTLRGKLLLEPDALDGFSALLTLTHAEHRGPQTESVVRPFDAHVSSYPPMPVFEPRSTGGVLETKWALSERLTLENTASVTDILVTRRALPGDGNVDLDAIEVAEEPRLRFSGFGGRLDGLLGLYLFHAEQEETIDLFGGGAFDDRTTTAAVFGEATIAVFERVDLTLGGRLEEERRRRVGADGPFAIDLDETYRVFLPKVGLAWHATDEVTVGAVVARGYNGGGAGFTYEPPFVSYTYDPEYVWDYEVYARADLAGGRLGLTANLFLSDYRDMQLPFDLNPDPAIWSFVVRNAERARTYGAELGVRWLAMPGLRLSAQIGLLETEITRYAESGLVGNELPRSPAFTADLGVHYRHASGVDLGVDARYTEAYYSDVLNAPRGKTDPYWVVGSQIGYSFSRARLFAFVENVFDEDGPVLLEPGGTPDADVAYLLRPRTFGIGLAMSL